MESLWETLGSLKRPWAAQTMHQPRLGALPAALPSDVAVIFGIIRAALPLLGERQVRHPARQVDAGGVGVDRGALCVLDAPPPEWQQARRTWFSTAAPATGGVAGDAVILVVAAAFENCGAEVGVRQLAGGGRPGDQAAAAEVTAQTGGVCAMRNGVCTPPRQILSGAVYMRRCV
jgi:hypothetical protein